MPITQQKAEAIVKSGKYQQFCLEKQIHKSADFAQASHVDHKAERREERRRKAASGKGGGGTQGRETKTKAVKNMQGLNKLLMILTLMKVLLLQRNHNHS